MRSNLSVNDLKDCSKLLCRICIIKRDGNHLKNILDPMIVKKLKECTMLEVSIYTIMNLLILIKLFYQIVPNDGLPKKICEYCVNKLNEAYDFKQLCHETQSILEELLRNINEESLKIIQNEDIDAENSMSFERSNKIKIEECGILQNTFEEGGSTEIRTTYPNSKNLKIFISTIIHFIFWGLYYFYWKTNPKCMYSTPVFCISTHCLYQMRIMLVACLVECGLHKSFQPALCIIGVMKQECTSQYIWVEPIYWSQ